MRYFIDNNYEVQPTDEDLLGSFDTFDEAYMAAMIARNTKVLLYGAAPIVDKDKLRRIEEDRQAANNKIKRSLRR